MRYISTFAGCGSEEFAIQQLGLNWRCVGWCENDKHAIKTHNANHPHLVGLHHPDITGMDWESIEDCDMILGGFPCPSFSLAGKRKGFDDENGQLFFHLLEGIKKKRPKFFLMENVKGLLSAQNGEVIHTIRKMLMELGYDVGYRVMNTRDFGLPQNRDRVWIYGVYNEPDTFIRMYHKMEKLPYWGDAQIPKTPLMDVLDHNVSEKYSLSEASIQRMQDSIEYVNQNITSPNELWIVDDGASPRYQKPMREMSPTLKATRSNYAILPLYRRLTPIECFRLQGFHDIIIPVSDSQAYKQAGNGWSLPVVKEIFKVFESLTYQ